MLALIQCVQTECGSSHISERSYQEPSTMQHICCSECSNSWTQVRPRDRHKLLMSMFRTNQHTSITSQSPLGFSNWWQATSITIQLHSIMNHNIQQPFSTFGAELLNQINLQISTPQNSHFLGLRSWSRDDISIMLEKYGHMKHLRFTVGMTFNCTIISTACFSFSTKDNWKSNGHVNSLPTEKLLHYLKYSPCLCI